MASQMNQNSRKVLGEQELTPNFTQLQSCPYFTDLKPRGFFFFNETEIPTPIFLTFSGNISKKENHSRPWIQKEQNMELGTGLLTTELERVDRES